MSLINQSSRIAGWTLSPVAHAYAVWDALRFLFQHRILILAMARRDISNRYAGQILGSFWAAGHPLFQMSLLVFVFSVVFKQKVGGTFEMPRDYTTYILSGLAAWLSLSPMLNSSTTAIVDNANLVKQFTFDARVLPAKEIAIGGVVWVICVAVVIGYTLIVEQSIAWTYVLIPVVAAMHFLTALGCGWALAGLAVFFRDLKDFVTLATTALIYLLPIVYLPNWTPELFRPLIYFNPFSHLIWVYQDVFYFGRIQHPLAWLISIAFALLMVSFGYRIFRRLQPMFGGAL